MKKKLVLLVGIIIVVFSQTVDLPGANHKSKLLISNESPVEDPIVIDAEELNEEKKTAEDSKEELLHEIFKNLPEQQYDRKKCQEVVNNKYPGAEEQFQTVLSEAYMDGDMAAGQSPYQTMSIDNLKALADANDATAMMIYGSDQIWIASTGLMINNRSDSSLLSTEEKKEIVKGHQVDLNKLQEGEEYLFRAAVFGKVPALFEYHQLTNMTIRKLIANGAEDYVVKNALANVRAYSKLSYELHRNDEVLRSFFVDTMAFTESLSLKGLSERVDFEEVNQDISKLADERYLVLIEKWKAQREYYGFDIYPDLLQGELEDYSKEIEKCWTIKDSR